MKAKKRLQSVAYLVYGGECTADFDVSGNANLKQNKSHVTGPFLYFPEYLGIFKTFAGPNMHAN